MTRAFAAFFAMLLFAPAALAADPMEMEWRELADDVWVGVRPVSYRSPVMTNTTIVVGEKGVLVFDAAGFALQGERLVKKVAELTDKPVTHIAISHWHGDHSLGDYKVLEKFPAAEVIAHDFTASTSRARTGDGPDPRPQGGATYRTRVEKALATASVPTARRSRRDARLYVELLEHIDFRQRRRSRASKYPSTNLAQSR